MIPMSFHSHNTFCWHVFPRSPVSLPGLRVWQAGSLTPFYHFPCRAPIKWRWDVHQPALKEGSCPKVASHMEERNHTAQVFFLLLANFYSFLIQFHSSWPCQAGVPALLSTLLSTDSTNYQGVKIETFKFREKTQRWRLNWTEKEAWREERRSLSRKRGHLSCN